MLFISLGAVLMKFHWVIWLFGGFLVLTRHIRLPSLSGLLWVIGLVAFFLSSILDNMTTTIVMVSLMKRLLRDHGQRQLFAGAIVIAANAGGAWTPIGDVTTTMLWIGGQITSLAIMQSLLLPSLACLVVPLVVLGRTLQGPVVGPKETLSSGAGPDGGHGGLMLVLGLAALVSVPVFKTVTHLPPWLGILLALGVLWLIGEFLQRGKPEDEFAHLTVARALKRIDLASAVEANKTARRRYVTKAMHEVEFHEPVFMGDVVSFYTETLRVGRTSVTVKVSVVAERWGRGPGSGEPKGQRVPVTQAEVVLVAVDESGRPVPIHPEPAQA